jgi:hypothetical protein
MLVFSLVIAVSTFGHSTLGRHNNTHCTYGVNLKHEGSISELHCAKSFFLARATTVHFFVANNNTLECEPRRYGAGIVDTPASESKLQWGKSDEMAIEFD